MQETGHSHFVGCVQDGRSISALRQGVEGQREVAEGLGVGLLKRQRRMVHEAEAREVVFQATGIGQRVLDGQLHVWQPELSLDAAVVELHAAVHDALGMDDHLDLVWVDVKQPLGFNDFQSLVHEGGAVDGDFGTHVPVGVLEGIGLGDVAQLFECAAPEGTARGRQNDLFDGVVKLPRNALVDGAVFRIHGVDVHAFVAGSVHHQFAGHHEGLFVGQRNVLACVDGPKGGLESGRANHGSEHHVDAVDFDDLFEGFCTAVDFDAVVEQGVVDLLPLRVVADDDRVGLEFFRLRDQQIGVAMGRQDFHVKGVLLFTHHLERLGANGPGRAEDGNAAGGRVIFRLAHHRNPSSSLASSLIMSCVHAGSNTMVTLHPLAPSSEATLFSTSCGRLSATGQLGEVSVMSMWMNPLSLTLIS